jgi:hypothetical protein
MFITANTNLLLTEPINFTNTTLHRGGMQKHFLSDGQIIKLHFCLWDALRKLNEEQPHQYLLQLVGM